MEVSTLASAAVLLPTAHSLSHGLCMQLLLLLGGYPTHEVAMCFQHTTPVFELLDPLLRLYQLLFKRAYIGLEERCCDVDHEVDCDTEQVW